MGTKYLVFLRVAVKVYGVKVERDCEGEDKQCGGMRVYRWELCMHEGGDEGRVCWFETIIHSWPTPT